MAIDYGPLLVFFAITFVAPAEPMRALVAAFTRTLNDLTRVEALLIARVICATAGFVIATVIAMAVSKAKLGTISPMLWISGALVVVFGGLTIYFADPRFIKMKPTFVYAIFASVLVFGLITRRPLLQQLLGAAYPGLTEAGWIKLTRNWAIFFVVMAIANELVWRWTAATMSDTAAFRAWTLYKFPGCVVITLLFAFANIPMLMKHGLNLEGDAVPTIPPEA
ncbi:septation protein IspZ [Sphingomonas oligophenolica]|uniref:Inner membrane-spanning protein YciB n=2 Tax=Sphingomonas oligophenolica TaxID=301154 RepID=A0A502CHP4_9SPHN|nr:septation protein IspZ [Sphingomonas oligophenolica]